MMITMSVCVDFGVYISHRGRCLVQLKRCLVGRNAYKENKLCQIVWI
jgi:hypothetical protein